MRSSASELARAARLFADPQRVLDAVVCSLSEVCSGALVVGYICESHPALAIGLSASYRAGRQVDWPGLEEAFVLSPTKFDRWSVQRDQQNRWQYLQYARLGDSALSAYWQPKFAEFWRIVLCERARPLAYMSVAWEGDAPLPPMVLRSLKTGYRQLSSTLRLAALEHQSRQKPAVTDRGHGSIVLAPGGLVLAASPTARRWLKRDARLQGWLADRSRPRGRVDRLEHLSLQSSSLEVSGHVLERVDLYATTEPAPTQLHEDALVGLSPREAELCEWLALGLTNAVIAQQMGVAPSTVKTMLERLYWKRSLSGRVALVRSLLAAHCGRAP